MSASVPIHFKGFDSKFNSVLNLNLRLLLQWLSCASFVLLEFKSKEQIEEQKRVIPDD